MSPVRFLENTTLPAPIIAILTMEASRRGCPPLISMVVSGRVFAGAAL